MSAVQVIVIMGPTASGKTAAGIAIAEALNTEIVSVDSRQVYRELPIGSGAPSAEELQQVRHHLIGTHSVIEPLNAADYAVLAREALADIIHRRGIAILAGGSTLYMQAILKGMDSMPPIPDALRVELRQKFSERGIDWLQEEVRRLDPEYASTSDLRNHARLLRALEVMQASGKPWSEWRTKAANPLPWSTLSISIEPDRDKLYEAINLRCLQMLKAGLLEEARPLISVRGLPPLQAPGYSEAFDLFEGKLSEEAMVTIFQQRTRNYAKRQMTWLRRISDRKVVGSPEEAIEYVLRMVHV